MLIIMLAGLFTIGVLIFIHELGHFLAARAMGIHVHRFSIGMGPVLVRWRAAGTEWALSLLPFGGYVKMAGMEIPVEGETPPGEDTLPPSVLYRNKPIWRRLTAVIAGPLANLILAVLVAVGVIYTTGEPIYPGTWLDAPTEGTPAAAAGLARGDRVLSYAGGEASNWNELLDLIIDADGGRHPLVVEREGEVLDLTLDVPAGTLRTGLASLLDNRVGKVLKGGPADRLGLERGDRIVAVDGRPVRFFNDIAGIVNEKAGEPVSIVWEREGRRLEGMVTPQAADAADPAAPGQTRRIGRIFFEEYLEWRPVSWGDAFAGGARWVWITIKGTVAWLAGKITGRYGAETMGGPITIFRTAGEMARWGIDRLLIFIAFFSTQLFLFNLLPIPVLDGGHVVFLALEGLRLPVNESVRLRLTMAGLLLLVGLMLFIVVQELNRFVF
jgi:regulator of sigma E protease